MTKNSIEFGFTVEPKGHTPSQIKQIHGGTCVELARTSTQLIPCADAIVSHGPPVHIFTADCLPVLLSANDTNGPIAAVHAGWRGARDRVVSNTVAFFGGVPVRAVLGPCLGPCCFEVKDDLVASFREANHDISHHLTVRSGKRYFDLVQFVICEQLKGVEVDLSNVECTYCSPRAWPSFRRTRSTDPRIRAWIIKSGQTA